MQNPHAHHDHDMAMSDPTRAKEMEKDMKKRFLISFFLSILVFLYSPVWVAILKINFFTPIAVNWLLFLLTTPIVFWTGSIFNTWAYYSLKSKKLNMSVLVATGVLSSYVFSVILTLLWSHESYYEASALLVTFVLFGHWMEMKSRRWTTESLRKLFDLIPKQANVIRHGKEIQISSSEIVKWDTIIARPGDKIAVDGEIMLWETIIDESLVTWESIPVTKNIWDTVIWWSINQTWVIRYTATKVWSETVLSQIIDLVQHAQNSKAPWQRLADKAAWYLVILALLTWIITFLGWYIFWDVGIITSLNFAISAIVIACPDALWLATPTAVAVWTWIWARNNILIKDASTLENTSKITTIAIDKTGTLTQWKPNVTDIIALEWFNKKDILMYAASIESNSNHPISKAIVEESHKQNLDLFPVDNFLSISGLWIKWTIKNSHVVIWKEILLKESWIHTWIFDTNEISKQWKTLSLISIDNKFAWIIAVADTIKPTSKKAVEEFKKLWIEVIMITWDNKDVAQNVAQQLWIERFFAEVLPQDKSKHIETLQKEWKFVAMVWDGINDAPALAQADIWIAIGAWTDVAIETWNIVLMKSDPLDIIKAIKLSKATVNKMKQNLFWAVIYNLLAIPVAAWVFYTQFWIFLRPELSAILMSLSSMIVAINAVLLKRVESKL